jgi:hypothetical protein
MHRLVDTAGERLSIDCRLPWVAELIDEGAAGAFRNAEARASVSVRVEANRRPFPTRGWTMLTRGAWRRGGDVVVENACTAGFDLHLRCTDEVAHFTLRWRPPARDHTAAWVLRSRFHLLARAVLMQYPVLWWAGTRGRVPLHASACDAGAATPLLVAQSGIGRSTLLLRQLRCGGRATGDNLAVADGTTVWGLVEPMRVDSASGRRMPHGRRELPLPARAGAMVPDNVVVLHRGAPGEPAVERCDEDAAAAAFVTSTYAAGELRRYWGFAAILSAGTGLGPPHPPITEVASTFASRLPCRTLAVGPASGPGLTALLDPVEVVA